LSQEENTYDLIEQYLQGELADNHPFVLQIKDDKELAMEVEVHRLIPEAVVDYRLMSVEKLVAKKRVEFIAQDSFNWKKLFWALPVLIVATLTYLVIPETKQVDTITNDKVSVSSNVTIEQKVEKQAVESVKEKKVVIESIQIAKSKEIIGSPEKVKNIEVIVPEVIAPVLVEEKKQESVLHAEKIESVVAKNESEATPANPCLGIRLKAYVEEGRPCLGNSEGYLNLKDVRGGKAPYQFSINKEHFQENNKFAGLKSGEYDVIVKDANNCETIIYEKYSLKSKNCVQFTEHVFNPNTSTWDVPNHLEKAGELDVFDKMGQRIFVRSFDKSEKITWGGTANNGELLLPGVYIYSIKYSDGVVEQGRITITY
jgi:hypothetical protein